GIRDGHVTGVQTCALPIFGDRRGEERIEEARGLRSGGNQELGARGGDILDVACIPDGQARPVAEVEGARGAEESPAGGRGQMGRSEERRVGKEGRSRWASE